MPDALNEVFCVNDRLEDIGGLVDVEDLTEGNGGAGGNDEDGANEAMPAKKTFVTSCLGTDGGSVAVAGGITPTTRRTRQGAAALTEKLLSSISSNSEARPNDHRDVMRLYLQQIRSLEDTVQIRELQIDALRQELTNSQDKLHTTMRELDTVERKVDRLEMRLEMMEMMGTHRSRSPQHSPTGNRKRPRSPSDFIYGRHSQSPSQSKLSRMESPVISDT